MATKARSGGRRDEVSLTGLAYRAIKDEIVANQLEAGQPVPVERFAKDLKLSRTPVREAILQLAREGFIEIRPRMGTFVSHLNLRQIQELYEVRSVLEGRAARLAARNASPAQLEEVRRRLESQKVAEPVDAAAMSEAGHELHRLILGACGNRTLERMILSLYDHFARFRRLSLELPGKVESSHDAHLAILEALEARDGDLAERRVQQHFEHAARYLMEGLLTSRDAAGALTIRPEA